MAGPNGEFQIEDLQSPIDIDLLEFFAPQDLGAEARAPITEEELGPLIEDALARGVSMEDIQFYVMDLLSNVGAPAQVVRDRLTQLVQQADEREQIDENDAATDAIIAEQLGYVDEAERQLTERAAGYQELLDQPGKIRSDEEFGRILGIGEGQIAAGVENDTRRVGAATAGSGLRSSGRATDQVQRIREGGRRTRADLMGGVGSEIRGRLGGVEDRLTDIPLIRSDIEAGRFPSVQLSGLNRLDTTPRFSGYEPFDFGFGIDTFNRGARDEGTGRIFGGINDIGDDFTDVFETFARRD